MPSMKYSYRNPSRNFCFFLRGGKCFPFFAGTIILRNLASSFALRSFLRYSPMYSSRNSSKNTLRNCLEFFSQESLQKPFENFSYESPGIAKGSSRSFCRCSFGDSFEYFFVFCEISGESIERKPEQISEIFFARNSERIPGDIYEWLWEFLQEWLKAFSKEFLEETLKWFPKEALWYLKNIFRVISVKLHRKTFEETPRLNFCRFSNEGISVKF